MGCLILFKQLVLFFGILLSIISFLSGCVPFSMAVTFCVLILSTVSLLVNFSNKGKILKGSSLPPGTFVRTYGGSLQKRDGELVDLEKFLESDGDVCQLNKNTLVGSDIVDLDTKSIDDFSYSSGDSEDDWCIPYNMGQVPASSEESISDEESLIEIALQSGHHMESGDTNMAAFLPNLQDFLHESISDQHGLKELFSEINEEDNLIEIDIAVGSIKNSP